MTLVSKPNSWVAVDAAATTALTYAPRVDPAPWTVSVPKRDPELASFEVVITNQSRSAVAVDTIDFTFHVGSSSSDLTPTTAGVLYDVSDTSTWQVTGPSSPVTSGTATYTLGPATGTSATLAPGASVVVELYQIQTGQSPGTATIAVKEMLEGQAPAFTSFAVTTFPDGFYFDGLIACIQQGSRLAPVSQVDANSTVTLVWNSSLADVGAVDVYYSTAAQGQQHASPTVLGEWTSPPLASDTTFVVVVTASGAGGAPLTAALATAVSVRNPALIAGSLQTGQATVNGPASVGGQLTANAITANAVTVDGHVTASGATVNGSLTANGATLNGGLNASGPVVSTGGTSSLSALTVPGNVSAGTLNAGATSVSGLTANRGRVMMVNPAGPLNAGTYTANTDGFAIGVVGWPDSASPGCVGYATGQCGGLRMIAVGGNLGAFGPGWSKAQASNGNSFTLPVASGSTFYLTAQQINGDLHQADAPIWFYWIRLGTEPGATGGCELVGPPPPSELPVDLMKSTYEEARVQVVELLERMIGRPIDQEDKQEFIKTLRRL
jgi:hypothetical protein